MLFCKPLPKNGILCEHPMPYGQTLKFRSLILKKDIPIVHHWALKHASRFWQPEGSFEKIKVHYESVLNNPDAHSFAGLLDEQLICILDLFHLPQDEQGRYIDARTNDCRLHVIMAPTDTPIQGLSRQVISRFLNYFFSFTDSRYLYSAPDIHHTKACRLLEKCNFIFLQNIMLRTKAASLYMIRKDRFLALRK